MTLNWGTRTVPISLVLGGGRDGREIECLGAAYREGLEKVDVGGVRFVFNDGKMKETRSWGVVRVTTKMAAYKPFLKSMKSIIFQVETRFELRIPMSSQHRFQLFISHLKY